MTNLRLLRNTPATIGIVGHSRSGKDTVAQRLVNEWDFTRFAFADPLRYFCDLLYPENAPPPFTPAWLEHWEGLKEADPVTIRRRLQDTGMSARKGISADVWVHALDAYIGRHPDVQRWVIPDVRLLNEAIYVNHTDTGYVWGVTRPGTAADGHAAEAEIDSIIETLVDIQAPVLRNDASIEELHEQVDAYAAWVLGE